MAAPMLFKLVRDEDVSGVSGTGEVADGVLWPDGAVALRWRGERPSTVHYNRIDDVKHVHGHNGSTRIVLVDPSGRLGRIADAHSKSEGPHGTTSGLCGECGFAWPCPTNVWASTERDLNEAWDPRDDEIGEAP
ncbi:hypothetical protein [Nonomuraea phyllanthi]|uniref:hypothetical protein n=1 Tax=Nonomuraea phyllanthi TaxID=2219224 RepID=UPI00186B063F|nr:hypothetical protein [Nonomuraea phyllanthi]